MVFSRLYKVFCFASIFLIFIFYSCETTKNVPYFADISDTAKPVTITTADYNEPIIQGDDLLSIMIQTIDPQANSAFTQSNSSFSVPSLTGANQTPVSGYLVDKQGSVSIPFLGDVKVAGLTTFQARDSISKVVSKFYKNPTVQVRFANFKITVIGEVARPATYLVPNEKITIMDALGLAGDLTIFGKRENVLLIRDSIGAKKFVRLNLNSSSIVHSSYFFLRQNDVVYVEPNKAKIVSTDASRTRTLAIFGSVLSLLIVIVSRLIK